MLSLAIKSQIPIVKVHTTDLVNFADVLRHLAPGKKIAEAKPGSFPHGIDVVYTTEQFVPTKAIYESIIGIGKVLILINQEETSPFAFDAGEVPVPKELMLDLLSEVISHREAAKDMLSCFNGLTLKTMAEVIRLTTARDGALTAKGVAKTRSMITGKLQGLEQVDVDVQLYHCPSSLKGWVSVNKRYFLDPKDDRLIPRGILLNGEPGVGKSMGAKYIAKEFDVPLYRLDLSSALGKWVGESEAAFSRILTTLDQEEPCVLLVDEIEKLFSESEDQGVTARLLSQFLWWAAEHKSRVLTVMTTNSMNALPKELYRAGRIDRAITIRTLNYKEAKELAFDCLSQFIIKPSPNMIHSINDALDEEFKRLQIKTEEWKGISHANIIQIVHDLIKTNDWIVKLTVVK